MCLKLYNMKNILSHVEQELVYLLANDNNWKSVYVDYHKPFVKRLYTNFMYQGHNYRIYLHQIESCDINEALFHPHPWPSIMKLLSGSYNMFVGYGEGLQSPPVAVKLELPTDTIYEMSEINAWHAVAPILDNSFSLMITGEPWQRESHKSTKTLYELSLEEKKHILDFFRNIYK